MKLLDIISNLDAYPERAVILAERPWSAGSRAVVEVIEVSDYTKVEKDGMAYFMLVTMAAISRERFLRYGLTLSDTTSLCEALIDRAMLRPTQFDPPRPILPTPTARVSKNEDDAGGVAFTFDHSKTLQDFAALSDQQRGRAF